MKLGEKLQQLRRQSGLSQEQLAAQLTVSRQAVSKWELDETMPDTENVIQLSRLFGVSCDYLLREEVDEQGAAVQLAAPEDRHSPTANDRSGDASAAHASAAHLDEQGWVRNAAVLSLGVCAIGLLVACISWWYWQSPVRLFAALMIQVVGLVLFELAVPRMGKERAAARSGFYMAACWLLLPIPMYLLRAFLEYYVIHIPHLYWDVACVGCWLLLSAAVTAVLGWLRWSKTHKS